MSRDILKRGTNRQNRNKRDADLKIDQLSLIDRLAKSVVEIRKLQAPVQELNKSQQDMPNHDKSKMYKSEVIELKKQLMKM